MSELKNITEFDLFRKFKSVKGNEVSIIGTGTAKVSEVGSNGYCTCGYKYRESGVCVRCYLLGTIDVIKVNGVNVAGGYRRGTVLKMAGLVSPELNEICYNDSVVAIEKVFGQFSWGAVAENYYRAEMKCTAVKDGDDSPITADAVEDDVIELN